MQTEQQASHIPGRSPGLGGQLPLSGFAAGTGQRGAALADRGSIVASGPTPAVCACSLFSTKLRALIQRFPFCTKRKLSPTSTSPHTLLKANPTPTPSSLDFPTPTSCCTRISASIFCRVRNWAVSQPPVPLPDLDSSATNSEQPRNQKISHISSTESPPLFRSANDLFSPTTTLRHQSSIRSKALFMYQHDKNSVFRHTPPRPFRIARKPCSPNISSDG
jgi:hypothetical protein